MRDDLRIWEIADAEANRMADKINQLKEQQNALMEVLKMCVSDLKVEIDARYGMPPIHPALKNQHNRDMYPIEEAKKLIDSIKAQEANA